MGIGGSIPIGGRTVKITQQLGEGGYSFVYLVQDESDGREFALKRMLAQNAEAVQLAKKEVELMKILKHPNIVQYYGACSRKLDNGTIEYFVLMELCSGGHVFDNIQNRGNRKFPEKTLLNIFHSACQAVAVLHHSNPPIAHRDLKIENILLSRDGKWKLCDFGSCTTRAQVYDNKGDMAKEEERIQKYTTAMYRAPEMCDLYRHQLVNEKVDIWALGCILYTCAFFVQPFQDGGNLQIINAAYHMPEDHNYSPYLIRLIQVLLTSDPEARPNIDEVLEMNRGWAQYLKTGKGELPAERVSVSHKKKKKDKKDKKKKKNKAEQKDVDDDDDDWNPFGDADADASAPPKPQVIPKGKAAVTDADALRPPPDPKEKKHKHKSKRKETAADDHKNRVEDEFASFEAHFDDDDFPGNNSTWQCAVCTLINRDPALACSACGAAKNTTKTTARPRAPSSGSDSGNTSGSAHGSDSDSDSEKERQARRNQKAKKAKDKKKSSAKEDIEWADFPEDFEEPSAKGQGVRVTPAKHNFGPPRSPGDQDWDSNGAIGSPSRSSVSDISERSGSDHDGAVSAAAGAMGQLDIFSGEVISPAHSHRSAQMGSGRGPNLPQHSTSAPPSSRRADEPLGTVAHKQPSRLEMLMNDNTPVDPLAGLPGHAPAYGYSSPSVSPTAGYGHHQMMGMPQQQMGMGYGYGQQLQPGQYYPQYGMQQGYGMGYAQQQQQQHQQQQQQHNYMPGMMGMKPKSPK